MTTLGIVYLIYLICLPFTLILLANRDKISAVDPEESNLLVFFKIWLISPVFLIYLIISKF